MFVVLALGSALAVAKDQIAGASSRLTQPSDRLAVTLLKSDVRRATSFPSSSGWSSDDLALRQGSTFITYRHVDQQLLRLASRGTHTPETTLLLPQITSFQWRTPNRGALEIAWVEPAPQLRLSGGVKLQRPHVVTLRVARRSWSHSWW